MKYSITFIGLLISNSIFSQFVTISDWNSKKIIDNSIHYVTIYMEAPSMAYPHVEKDGLVKIHRIDFNEHGLIIKDTCFNCISLESGYEFNQIKTYQYKDIDLILEKDYSFDTVTYTYKYDSVRKDTIQKIGKNNLDKTVKIESILKQGGLIQKKIQIDFTESNENKDSICNINVETYDYNYSKRDTIIIIHRIVKKGLCFDTRTCKLIENSMSLLLKNNNFKSLIYKGPVDTTILINDNRHNQIKLLASEKCYYSSFTYDNKDLLTSETWIPIKCDKKQIRYIYRYDK